METKEERPEVDLAQAFVKHATSHLWPPEVEPGEHGKYHGSKEHVVEVRNYEV